MGNATQSIYPLDAEQLRARCDQAAALLWRIPVIRDARPDNIKVWESISSDIRSSRAESSLTYDYLTILIRAGRFILVRGEADDKYIQRWDHIWSEVTSPRVTQEHTLSSNLVH